MTPAVTNWSEAAAQLRLCLESLLLQRDALHGTLDQSIGKLVERGMPELAQQAADIARVWGNEGSHAKEAAPTDFGQFVSELFGFVTHIAAGLQYMSSVSFRYGDLPKGKLDGIAAREQRPRKSSKQV